MTRGTAPQVAPGLGADDPSAPTDSDVDDDDPISRMRRKKSSRRGGGGGGDDDDELTDESIEIAACESEDNKARARRGCVWRVVTRVAAVAACGSVPRASSRARAAARAATDGPNHGPNGGHGRACADVWLVLCARVASWYACAVWWCCGGGWGVCVCVCVSHRGLCARW